MRPAAASHGDNLGPNAHYHLSCGSVVRESKCKSRDLSIYQDHCRFRRSGLERKSSSSTFGVTRDLAAGHVTRPRGGKIGKERSPVQAMVLRRLPLSREPIGNR